MLHGSVAGVSTLEGSFKVVDVHYNTFTLNYRRPFKEARLKNRLFLLGLNAVVLTYTIQIISLSWNVVMTKVIWQSIKFIFGHVFQGFSSMI